MAGRFNSSRPLTGRLETTDRLRHEFSAFDPEQPRMNINSSTLSNQRGAVIAKLEDIFESITDQMLVEKPFIISMKSRLNIDQALDARSGVLVYTRDAATVNITWPAATQRESWKFAVILRIMSLCHEALVNGVVTTKRDIYYRDPELFIKQAVVDRYVDDIAFTLDVPRQALNVAATAKGLFNGVLRGQKHDGQFIVYSAGNEDTLVRNISDTPYVDFTSIKWILVIEKEATFRTLSNSSYSSTSKAGSGLIVTAKGYPDISTRSFLHTLRSHYNCPPMYVLTDFDPHGLSILNTYVHGSSSLAHENQHLAVPDMTRLGIRLEDVIQTQSSSSDDEHNEVSGILPMSLRDRQLATSMLASNPAFAEETHPEWRRELQCMLFLNIKAEIQILGGAESLSSWVDDRILSLGSQS